MYSNLGAAGIFCSINLVVVCGNLFVLYVLVSQKSLHTSTNFIVLSLTVADFLLGIVVVPFAILQEFSHTWLFGDVWCKSWLALDVLLSTASIYNLLAISFDRYMAVRQPIKYRLISSSRMTKITISVVWIISALLAFPPLVYEHLDSTLDSTSLEKSNASRPTTCSPATSNDVYILFSAFVSFILPAVLMVFLNIRIFQTVAESRRLPVLPGKAVSSEDMSTLLRIHRGDAKNTATVTRCDYSKNGRRSTAVPQSLASNKLAQFQRSYSIVNEKSIRAKQSFISTRKQTVDTVISLDRFETDSVDSPTKIPLEECRQKLKNDHIDSRQKSITEPETMPIQGDIKAMLVQAPLKRTNSAIRKTVDASIWYPAIVTTLLAGKKTKKNAERLLLFPLLQASRNNIRTELRVARTIGVVVGCFTICWLPFTIIYILQRKK
uniref:G-protein coupled receptors family 1 profile domain-containing protein n=1 Tax=Acrobeloides nanus TaxID=290746 RepID=A0A914CCL1_9BILA